MYVCVCVLDEKCITLGRSCARYSFDSFHVVLFLLAISFACLFKQGKPRNSLYLADLGHCSQIDSHDIPFDIEIILLDLQGIIEKMNIQNTYPT